MANVSTLITKSGRFEARREPGKPVLLLRTIMGRTATAWGSGDA